MLLLLSKQITKNDIGLYMDDGLAILKNTSGPAAKKLKKKFQKLFKEKDLDILVQCNWKITNYLDITLKNPAKKSTILTSIQTTLHQSLKRFYNQLKKDLQFCHHQKIFYIFQKSPVYYAKCLKNSGYKTKLKYQKPKENNQNKKKRKRNIIRFHPPYSNLLKTSIERIFIKIISKHFPPNHKFVKSFNTNAIKLCYSHMPNISSKIKSHNKKCYNPSPQRHKKYATALLKKIVQ